MAAPGAGTDQQIAALQQNLRAAPDAAGYAALGAAYLQKIREIGDSGYYPRAERALALALRREPRNLDAVIGLGTLALARHDFREGLALGRRARRLAPAAFGSYPIVIDALVELGRYDEAGRVLQRLLDGKPGLPAYARASYFRELQGNLTGAIEAMRLAVSAGSATPEGTASSETSSPPGPTPAASPAPGAADIFGGGRGGQPPTLIRASCGSTNASDGHTTRSTPAS